MPDFHKVFRDMVFRDINVRDMSVRLSIGAWVLAATIGLSPAHGDALPEKTTNDDTASKNSATLSISGSTSAETPPRQHVKHLRAHKKISVDSTSASTQPPDKSQNAQLPGMNAAPSDAGNKLAPEGAASSAATQAVARPRIKIARPHRETVIKTRPRSSDVSRTSRQSDFFSDIFGGDD